MNSMHVYSVVESFSAECHQLPPSWEGLEQSCDKKLPIVISISLFEGQIQ